MVKFSTDHYTVLIYICHLSLFSSSSSPPLLILSSPPHPLLSSSPPSSSSPTHPPLLILPSSSSPPLLILSSSSPPSSSSLPSSSSSPLLILSSPPVLNVADVQTSGRHMVYICQPQAPTSTTSECMGMSPKPKDYIFLSLISLICCLPLGVFALFKSLEVCVYI